jgi:hypothetical protein
MIKKKEFLGTPSPNDRMGQGATKSDKKGVPIWSAIARKTPRSPCSQLPTLESESSQKKAHTLLFHRRKHIIWVYRNLYLS